MTSEAPSGASGLRHISGILAEFLDELLDGEAEQLTWGEADAIVRDLLAQKLDRMRDQARVRRHGARECRCDRPWAFEQGRCGRCGHDLQGRAA